MFLYLYATCVASILFHFGAATPLPQGMPIYACPQGYQWFNGECKLICPPTHLFQNGACLLRVENNQPTSPCPLGSSSCQTVIAPIPVVTQPCPASSPSCPTAVVPFPVTQPCPVAGTSCQTVVAPTPVVTQPCPASSPSCPTAVAPIPVAQPCPVASTPCQAVIGPMPMPQPCPAASIPYPTAVAPCPTQQCPTPSCPTVTNCASPCPTPCPTPSCPNLGSYATGSQCQQPCSNICNPPPTQPTQPPPTQPPPPPPTQPPPPPPTRPPTRPPRPDPIIKCPTGSILINDYCHLIYCGQGIYRNGKCIQTVCPEGTVWTGSRCKIPNPHNHTTVHMTNVINTNINQTDVNRGINYTNNMVIYITESPIIIETVKPPPPPPPPIPTSTSSPPTNCCTVIAPRTCAWDGDRYSCRSRKYRQCGPICTHDYIYLKPPSVMPPPPPAPQPCPQNDCGYDPEPFYPDCSRCSSRIDDNCSLYCERPICQTRRCQSVDLRGYCSSYPGSIGCRPVDGCTQDWCGGY